MALAALNRYKNAGDIIVEVGVDCGLPLVLDPFQTTDAQYQRLITQLNIAGNALLTLYPWARLTQKGTINTVPGTQYYPLPNDFSSIIPDTLWRKDQNFIPGFGSISAQQFEYLVNVPLVGTINIIYREQLGGMGILPVPTETYAFTFEYVSRGWVTDAAQSGAFRDNVTVASDIVLFDPLLISRYLKMRWLKSTGFDASEAVDDFNLLLDNRASTDTSKPKLSMAGATGIVGAPLISVLNVPGTGFGQ